VRAQAARRGQIILNKKNKRDALLLPGIASVRNRVQGMHRQRRLVATRPGFQLLTLHFTQHYLQFGLTPIAASNI
jgi:hypothetical protein